MTTHHPFLWVAALAIVIIPTTLFLEQFFRQRMAWHPAAKMTEGLAKTVNLPRRPGEKLSDWTARVLAQHDELSAATDEFLDAALREGKIERVGVRGPNWMLPVDHPAAIRYARAKGGLPRADEALESQL